MAAGIKTQIAKFAQASAEPDAEFFFAESLSRIPSVDLKEIQRLWRLPSSYCPYSQIHRQRRSRSA